MYLIFDTETTGLPKNYDAPHTDLDNWPRLVQLAWQLHDAQGRLVRAQNLIVQPDGFTIPFNAEKIHGISTELAKEEGLPLAEVLQVFAQDIAQASLLIGHNVGFDLNIMGAEFLRANMESALFDRAVFDSSSEAVAEFTQIPGGRGGKFKFPKLIELHEKLFGEGFDAAHDAAYDVAATARCFFGLLHQGIAQPIDETPLVDIRYEAPVLEEANFVKKKSSANAIPAQFRGQLEQPVPFSHLYVHTQFSILQSTANIKKLIAKAKANGMEAIGITDLGNMHVAYNAVEEGAAQGLKVIMGCEVYVAEERLKKQFTKGNPDRRFQQVLLATDQAAYHRLSELVSLGYTEGYYAGFPRVDKALIAEHAEGLIALTGGLSGEIPNLILNRGEHEAEEAFRWWKETFGNNFYVSLQRHGLPEEDRVNAVLLRFAAKYDVKPVAIHDCYYLDRKDADAHDSLLCVKDGEKKSTPIGFGRGTRFGMPNDDYYFKSQEEMNELFSDIPVALENLQEVIDKCSPIKLSRDILMPRYEIPAEFEDQDDYLRHLSYEGAKQKYGEITPEIRDRLDLELKVIKDMGFPGYFLIVQDFMNEARRRGVSVGPGRGSAAGSAVAFCIGITNIDPIRYNLLFERFLNPERVSMPDIDIDFDDEGRQEVINYVVEKYGKNQVAQIITYGTMAAKMSIKDVARVMDLPLAEGNKIAKLVPEKPGTKLKDAIEQEAELRMIYQGDPKLHLASKVLQQAVVLEGSVRGTGIHAAGIIIAPDDITKYIPVCVSKDADLLVTQFDGKVVESAGMLKMDFLGLKTLTIIRDALRLIKQNKGIEIDIDTIPLDDPKTFELYQKGQTIGTFQFESEGMQMYLRDLKPTNIEDLIAMNALYRPGPMQFIPNFINRKHGKEPVEYPHDLLEPILNYSYGIMVYQEQIMQTAQILAGYTLGGADILRRAMGKKKKEEMDKQREIFVTGAREKNNIPAAKANEIFDVMQKFAEYGFNRSHSAAYSVVAYQTAYLKANYPAEYMAAVLTHNMNSIEKITFFIKECESMKLQVLGPDINESQATFSVNDQGQIRFGLAAIKGTGEAAVSAIIQEREANGPFGSIYEVAKRLNLRTVNKKSFESLAQAGAFDSFGFHRAQYFVPYPTEATTFLEKLLRYGTACQEEADSVSLFGAGGSGISEPPPPDVPQWSAIEKLEREKEVVGFYISGHPLGVYKGVVERLCNANLTNYMTVGKGGQGLTIAAVIQTVARKQTKNGSSFTTFIAEDEYGTADFALFNELHMEYGQSLQAGDIVLLKGKVQTRYNTDQQEFRISSINPIEDQQTQLCRGIAVLLSTKQLQEESFLQRFVSEIEKYPGDAQLLINIAALEQDLELSTRATKYQVRYDDDLLQSLEQMQLKYKVLY
ncbi:DNA polymerase III subunit alpha [Eisenibacter elegans]|uniref:DNA polymerase III subunit alpha n=1 Tax=Eisenibacter elegans TaxID=997 RepID=UPI000400E37A|nr:DNA polymerase III subunit alpha [Eisenibacter elegans]